MYTLVVHGGAGRWPERWRAEALTGVREAADRCAHLLSSGADALTAVVEAVAALEDAPVFNAGTGSALNLDGEAEMDAGVMVGGGLLSGNVAALKRTRNPVRVARAVMETTDHVLLVGEGALRFARAMGFPDYDPVTAGRRTRWRETLARLRAGEGEDLRRRRWVGENREADGGTVGAVARDRGGGLAAATSTGGTMMKLAGRVGDTPVPGAGNYADLHAAVSATGKGELMLRFVTARAVCEHVAGGMDAQSAVAAVLGAMAPTVGVEAGLIAVAADGTVGIAHGTPAMPHARLSEGGHVHAAMAV